MEEGEGWRGEEGERVKKGRKKGGKRVIRVKKK